MPAAEVLVTGGAGFIGSHLVEALVGRGFRVRVLDDLSSGRLENLALVRDQITFRNGSITDRALVSSLAEGCACVFHLAAIVSVPRSVAEPLITHDVNANGAINVLEAAKSAGARIVFSSSAAVYGNTTHVPVVENEPTHPISAYGAQKLYAETMVRLAALQGFESLSLRYFNVYGDRQDPTSPYSGVISIFADRVLRGEPLTIFGDGKQTRDFVHVSDVVRANLLAMESPVADGTALNIGTGIPTTLNDLTKALFNAAGKVTPVNHTNIRPGDIRDSYCNPSTVKEKLGFEAKVTLERGLKELISAG